MSRKIIARFHPEVDISGYTYPTEPDGPTDFDVTEYVTDEMVSCDYSSDVLKDVPTAPGWVQAWTGPFEIEILEEVEISEGS